MRPLELAGFLFAIVPVLALLALLPLQVGIAAAAVSCGILLGRRCGWAHIGSCFRSMRG